MVSEVMSLPRSSSEIFFAMSTTLSIDGSTSFVPVGLIRVLSIQQDTLSGTTEVSRSIKHDSIQNTLDLNSADGYATYEVVIKNLGQSKEVLSGIINPKLSIFANSCEIIVKFADPEAVPGCFRRAGAQKNRPAGRQARRFNGAARSP